ncbi:hypothetical protein [Kineococcus esterisolvens]
MRHQPTSEPLGCSSSSPRAAPPRSRDQSVTVRSFSPDVLVEVEATAVLG